MNKLLFLLTLFLLAGCTSSKIESNISSLESDISSERVIEEEIFSTGEKRDGINLREEIEKINLNLKCNEIKDYFNTKQYYILNLDTLFSREEIDEIRKKNSLLDEQCLSYLDTRENKELVFSEEYIEKRLRDIENTSKIYDSMLENREGEFGEENLKKIKRKKKLLFEEKVNLIKLKKVKSVEVEKKITSIMGIQEEIILEKEGNTRRTDSKDSKDIPVEEETQCEKKL